MLSEITAAETAKKLETMGELIWKNNDVGIFLFTRKDAEVLNAALSYMRRFASGELAEVKHAHWKQVHWKGWDGDPDEGTHPECSNCGEMPLLNGCEDYEESPCCPYCGAIMDGSDMRQTQDGKEDSHE